MKFGSELPFLQTHWPNNRASRVHWPKAVELLTCLLSSPEVSQAFTQKLLITLYLQNLSEHSCFPTVDFPSIDYILVGWLAINIFFSSKRKLPTETFSIIFTRGYSWLLCLIRGTFSTAIGYQSWIFKN